MFALLLVSGPARCEIVVIVSATTPVKTLSREVAKALFLGRISEFPGGARALPIDQSEGAPLRDSFYQKTNGMSSLQMKTYWTRMLFTGRGQPPVEVGDSDAVRRMVAANPGLVGYIDSEALDASVRAVLTVR
jgi:ABC-type phosphate transport system substrate-binding protein